MTQNKGVVNTKEKEHIFEHNEIKKNKSLGVKDVQIEHSTIFMQFTVSLIRLSNTNFNHKMKSLFFKIMSQIVRFKTLKISLNITYKLCIILRSATGQVTH